MNTSEACVACWSCSQTRSSTMSELMERNESSPRDDSLLSVRESNEAGESDEEICFSG